MKIAGTFCRKPRFQGFHGRLLVARREMRVAQGLLDVLVSQQFLHDAEVDPCHHETRGVGMAQDVRAEPFKAGTA